MTPTPNLSVLVDILARVEQAIGADRLLDAEIAIALDRRATAKGVDLEPRPDGYVGFKGQADKPAYWMSERYTGSIDAAVALVGRVLPGAYWDVQAGGCAWIRVDDADIGDAWNLSTPALSLCAAMLRALIDQRPDRG